eukprot:1186845-Prorocentrum_minimum.AAC.6
MQYYALLIDEGVPRTQQPRHKQLEVRGHVLGGSSCRSPNCGARATRTACCATCGPQRVGSRRVQSKPRATKFHYIQTEILSWNNNSLSNSEHFPPKFVHYLGLGPGGKTSQIDRLLRDFKIYANKRDERGVCARLSMTVDDGYGAKVAKVVNDRIDGGDQGHQHAGPPRAAG